MYFNSITLSGCPEAIKLLVGNKCDLPAEVDLSQAKVRRCSSPLLSLPHTLPTLSGFVSLYNIMGQQ